MRENYYIALGLDPEVLDPLAIERRIKEKQREWAKLRLSGPPKLKRAAAAHLEHLSDLRRVMLNPETVLEEARCAKRLIERERQAQLTQLDEQIALLAAHGGYTDDDLKHLVNNFRGDVGQPEIEQRIKAAGLARSAPETPKVRPRLDAVVARNIRENLAALGLDSLYQLLGLEPHNSAAALIEKTDALYGELRRSGKTDVQASARSELLGHCKRLFADAAAKAKYDQTLSEQILEGMKPNLELAGRNRYLSLDVQGRLTSQAIARGATPELARWFVLDYAAGRGWAVEGASKEPAKAASLRLCGYCGAIANAAHRDAHCRQCGEPLDETCPRCGVAVPTTTFKCPSCGCDTGDGPLMRALMAEAKAAAADGKLREARRTYDRVLAIWPDWQPARRECDALRESIAAIEREVRAIDELLATRQLDAARRRLAEAAPRFGQDAFRDVQSRLTMSLGAVSACLTKARRLEASGDRAGAIAAFEEALGLQRDCTDAEQALARFPPAAPRDLSVKPQGSGFALRWAPVEAGLLYLVVRKADGFPNAPDDGVRLQETRDQQYSDATAPTGTAWYYAVYALRGSIASVAAASSGPHLRMSEVANLALVPGDGCVTLSWRRPSGSIGARVERWAGEAATPSQSIELVTAGDSCVDSGLVNGVRHTYRVNALFADPAHAGRNLTTAGTTRSAVPAAPPKPVRDLRYERQGADIRVRWTPPTAGEVRLLQSPHPPSAREGDTLDPAGTERMGTLVPIQARDHCVFRPAGSITYLVPLVIAGDLAVVGRSIEIALLDSIDALRTRRTGFTIVLTWTWPSTVDEVLLLYRYDRFPSSPEDGDATATRCLRAAYERKGCWELHAVEERPHYFSVYAAATPKGPYSAPAQCIDRMGQERIVRYKLVRRRYLPLLPWVREVGIQLRADTDLRLSNLLLVGKPRALPLSPGDGMTLATIAQLQLVKGSGWIRVDRSRLDADTHLKLFFRDEAVAAEVRLLPGAASEMRVG